MPRTNNGMEGGKQLPPSSIFRFQKLTLHQPPETDNVFSVEKIAPARLVCFIALIAAVRNTGHIQGPL